MKARNGQVALYLVMVLLAIAVLMLVNVNSFLAVRSKNRMMNAVDEAALADLQEKSKSRSQKKQNGGVVVDSVGKKFNSLFFHNVSPLY